MTDRTTIFDSHSLTEDLALFGIEPIESRIYLYLVGKPPKSVLEISRETGLPRTSVYDGIAKLQEKGLIEKIVQHKNQRLKAYPVNILQEYIDKERNRAEMLQQKLEVLEKNIGLAAPSPLNTEVRYYHGANGLRQMLWNTLRAEDELVSYSQFGMGDIVGQRFTDKYAIERAQRSIISRVITNPEHVSRWHIHAAEHVKNYRRKLQRCRVIPAEQVHVSGDIGIYNNIFAAAYWEQGEVVGVEIENPEIVKSQKTLFNLAWQHGKDVDWDAGTL